MNLYRLQGKPHGKCPKTIELWLFSNRTLIKNSDDFINRYIIRMVKNQIFTNVRLTYGVRGER